jgi:putative transposase
MSPVRTSPYYPQSNGKLERWRQSLKRECIRPFCPLSLKEAQAIVEKFVDHYNTRRLHSAIGYVSPDDKLQGREKKIFAERDRKLQQAREKRAEKRRLVKSGHQDQMATAPVPAAG